MINKIFLILIIFSITIIPTSYAQLFLGEEANQKSIEVILDKSEKIHVKHVVSLSSNQVSVEVFTGIIEGSLKITSEDGLEVEFGKIGDDRAGITSLAIFPSKQNTIIEYDLKNISKLDGNMWYLNLSYEKTFSVLFPKETNIIFLNNNPINLENRKGISISGGGDVNLQYYMDNTKSVEEVSWEENKFNVEILTDSEIEKFNFEQTSKSISFQVNDKDKFVTLTMAKELLGGPYVVLLDDEKIQYSEFNKEGNNVSLSMKPESSGEIIIIGTTVIPEFSMFIPLIMGFLVVLTVPFMKKFNLH